MTTIKADLQAADRLLKAAVSKTRRLIRDGADQRDYLPVLDAAVIAAAVLLEERHG